MPTCAWFVGIAAMGAVFTGTAVGLNFQTHGLPMLYPRHGDGKKERTTSGVCGLRRG